jgi:predicted Co/Zn/Cd cation transporter (cation efflux family)
MYSLDFAAQVSRLCMNEVLNRGRNYQIYKASIFIYLETFICVYLGLKERKILRKSGNKKQRLSVSTWLYSHFFSVTRTK